MSAVGGILQRRVIATLLKQVPRLFPRNDRLGLGAEELL